MRGVIFPGVTGILCAALRSGLSASPAAYAAGVTVAPELPGTKTARMVTVRDDSGPDDGVQSRRRCGFNVWADSSVDAESLALLCMAILRNAADGKPITLIDQLSGPFKVLTDAPLAVGGKDLTNYFFTARVSVRGTNY